MGKKKVLLKKKFISGNVSYCWYAERIYRKDGKSFKSRCRCCPPSKITTPELFEKYIRNLTGHDYKFAELSIVPSLESPNSQEEIILELGKYFVS